MTKDEQPDAPDGAAARDLDRRPPVRPSLPPPEPLPPPAQDALPRELPLVVPVDLPAEVDDARPRTVAPAPDAGATLPPPDAPAPPPDLAVAPAPTARGRRRLGRGPTALLVAAGVLGLLLVLLELALAAAPSLINRSLRARGFELELGGLDVGLLAGDVELTDVVLRPKEGGEPLLRLGSLRADVRARALLKATSS